MNRPSLLLPLLFILSFSASAQKVKFELFTTANGLASNESHHLVQDDRGFLWLLNASRIYRYDGINFRMYPSPPSDLPGADELISGMTTYQDSLLFILAENHAILLAPYNKDWRSFPLREAGDEYVTEQQLLNFGPNNIFIEVRRSSAETGPNFFRFRDGQLESLSKGSDGFTPTAPTSEDASSPDFFLFHDKMLNQYDQSGRLVTEISIAELPAGYLALYNYKRQGKSVIFHTNHGLFLLEEGEDKLSGHPINSFLSTNWINDFQPMENGDIWVSGPSRGLYQYVAKTGAFYDHEDQLSEVFAYRSPLKEIFKDRTGILWIRTQLGLLKVTPEANLFDTYMTDTDPACIGFCSFRGITEDENGVIYAAFYSGIAKINPNTEEVVEIYPGFIPFGQTMEGPFIMSSRSSLNPSTGQVKIVPGQNTDESVYARDKGQQLWMGTGDVLKRLDTSTESWEWITTANFINPNPSVLYFGQHSNLLWRGAPGELASYDPASQTTESIKTRSLEVPISQVLAIEEEADKLLWLGTDVGLIQFDPTSQEILKRFTSLDGLPNDYIASLLPEGDSCLWLGTNKGLSRFDKRDESFINFFTSDGLAHNEFNRVSYFKARDGRMFFGGLQGLNAFYPSEVIQNYRIKNKAAQVVLSSFEKTDERNDTLLNTAFFGKTPQIELYHWDRSFTFEYALTDFENSAEVSYSFLMEGYEDQWSKPSSFNFTRFSSLPPGDYVFRVKARDSHGFWHPNELSVRVKVFPPWWETWWAYGLYVLLLLVLVGGIVYFLRRRWLLQNQLLLEQEEALRLKELDGFKSRLYTNLTHEFRTPLTVILGMTEQLEEETLSSLSKTTKKEQLKTGFQLIRRNGQNLLRLINQLLDLSKLEDQSLQLHFIQSDVINFLRYLTGSFQSLANSQNISLQFFSDIRRLDMDIDPDQLTQIYTNLVSNALKYTKSGGNIVIRTSSREQELVLEIQDSGIGIPKADLPNIFDRFYQVDGSNTRSGEGTGIGLAHTQELVKLLEGRIEVQSKVGEGSTFTLFLPIRNTAPEETLVAPVESTRKEITMADAPTPEEKQNLLIIEDNPDVVTYLKSCLKDRYQLEVAYNGQIGIEKALETIPDLIVSDVMMPEKDGFEVCDTLKHDQRTSHIPIILLTAKSDQGSRLTGLRKGADAYLAKPFDKEELVIRLEKLAALSLRLREQYASWAEKAMHTEVVLKKKVPNPENPFDLEDKFLQKIKLVVNKEIGNADFNPNQLSQALGLSSSQLYRKVKAITGTTPALFVRKLRLYKAKELLQTSDLNISEIAYEVGFSSPSYFSRSFAEEFGSSPVENRK